MGIANITNNILVDSGLIAGSANGIATLDSGGKIPATQLPNSVMEFKGVWSAATNTPTLANGTGNAGDVYEVSAAGTVDFGAGPISFSVGDYVVYDGSQWQFSSGQKGTITSLAFSAPLTGGTITTSGTVGITQASGSTDGYLSSTDWTTFNNKQNALTNPITGTGTTGQVAYFNGTTSITSESNLFWDATNDRLGVGTTSPAYRLQVDGASTAGFVTPLLIKNPSTNAASAVKMAFDGGGTIWGEIGSSYNTNNPYMAFFVRANSEKMRITDGGNVAIGTLLPTSYGSYTTLCINNAGNGAVIDLLQNDIRTGSIYTSVSGAGLNINTVTSNPLIFLTANTERARFTSGGNLLVGTTTDSGEKLQVNGRVKSSDFASNNGTVETRLSWSSTPAGVVGTISNHPLEFYTNSSPKMTLSSSGNLGLGVTPSAWLAGVRAFEIFSKGNAIVSSTSSQNLLTANAYFDGSWKYGSTAAASYYSQQNGVHAWFNAISGTINTGITFTQAMTLAATGNLLVGTTTDGGQKLQVEGTTRLNGRTTITGSSTSNGIVAQGLIVNPTLVAAANGDTLIANDLSATFTNGAFTGVRNILFRVNGTIGVYFFQNGNVNLGNIDDTGFRLDVGGTFRATGATTLSSTTISGLTMGGDISFGAGGATRNIFFYNPASAAQRTGIGYLGNTTSNNGGLLLHCYGSLTGADILFGFGVDTSTATVTNTKMALFNSTGNLSIGGVADISHAILQLSSTTKGFLPPRMTTTQKNAITTPTAGLVVYDTTTNKLCCYNGTTWNDLF